MITKSFVSYLFIISRKILRSLSFSSINESAEASSSKFFACNVKKLSIKIKKRITLNG